MSELDPTKIRGIVEAILMTAETPVSPGKFLGVLKGLNGRQLREAIDELKTEYDEAGHACTIAEVAGGFQLATRKEYGPWLRKFHERGRVRLSQAGLETLSIVAFKQPITRVELESIRGVNSSGPLNTLMEHDLVRIVGRSDGIGKPHLFGTTKEFLIHFGLKSLAELPKPRELAELLAAGERKAVDRGAAAASSGEAGEAVDKEQGAGDGGGPAASGEGVTGQEPAEEQVAGAGEIEEGNGVAPEAASGEESVDGPALEEGNGAVPEAAPAASSEGVDEESAEEQVEEVAELEEGNGVAPEAAPAGADEEAASPLAEGDEGDIRDNGGPS